MTLRRHVTHFSIFCDGLGRALRLTPMSRQNCLDIRERFFGMLKRMALLTALIGLGVAVNPVAYAQSSNEGGRPTFAELDADGDGALTKEELRARGEARFLRADTNNDGVLSREELLAASKRSSEARVDRMLERFDADNSGTLSQTELAAGRKGDRAERVFSRMDANNDGSVTQAEYEAAKEGRGKKKRGHKGKDKKRGQNKSDG